MPATEILIAANVRYATRLPKADWLSESDPYVRLVAGERDARTKTRRNQPSPHWGHTIVVPVEVDLEAPSGTYRLEVWDEDVGPDDLLASVELDLGELVRERRLERTLELSLAEGREPSPAGNPELGVALAWQRGYAACKAALADVPGLVADDEDRELLVPVAELGPDVWLEVEFGKRDVDLELLVASTDTPYHYAIEPGGGRRVRVKSKRYDPPKPKKRGRGAAPLQVTQEVEVDDAAIDGDFSQLVVSRATRSPVDRKSLAELIAAVGGQAPGGLRFEELTRLLAGKEGVHLDPRDEEAVFPGEGFAVHVELDDDEWEVSLLVEAGAAEDVQHELVVPGRDLRRRLKRYQPPKRIGGKAFAERIGFEDLPRDVGLGDVYVERYRLTEPERWPLTDLLPLEPRA